MLQYIYFGRLDTEKWREAILGMVEDFLEKWKLPFVLHIFGKGSYEERIVNLAKQAPEHIIYYGFQPLDIIQQTAEHCDYALMPSLFLETFGLSAVNALSRWLPVIGYQQWGMSPFVLDAYNLWSFPGSPRVQLTAMMETLIKKWAHDEYKTCQKIATDYSKKHWMDRFSTLSVTSRKEWQWMTRSIGENEQDSSYSSYTSLPSSSKWQKSKKILLVTDFITKLGGIETYVHDVAQLLTQQWYTVDIIGSSWWKTKLGRLLSMVISSCNVLFAYRLHKKIQQFSPDVIRCHSVLRYVGWLPLMVVNKSKANKWMMYHDLWYFHPFPHTVTQENQIPASLDWNHFSVSIHNCVMKFFVWGKWLLLKQIQKQLKQFDQHLVPSEFMTRVVVKNYNKNVTVLPHFIQE
jgi:glycosyltransferase involved in cell wall biosynthesis